MRILHSRVLSGADKRTILPFNEFTSEHECNPKHWLGDSEEDAMPLTQHIVQRITVELWYQLIDVVGRWGDVDKELLPRNMIGEQIPVPDHPNGWWELTKRALPISTHNTGVIFVWEDATDKTKDQATTMAVWNFLMNVVVTALPP